MVVTSHLDKSAPSSPTLSRSATLVDHQYRGQLSTSTQSEEGMQDQGRATAQGKETADSALSLENQPRVGSVQLDTSVQPECSTSEKTQSVHTTPDLQKTCSLESFKGKGTMDDPYIVEWQEGDPENPLNWNFWTRWIIVADVAMCTLCVAFGSSLYAGGIAPMIKYFGSSSEVLTIGLSLYVLGFALGPLLWAPFSEMFGRRIVFICTYCPFVLFHIGCGASRNIETLLLCRFFAGLFGSAPLTNSGGVISDIFNSSERALALSMFALAPFAGPILGPIVGGFVGQNINWRWLFWIQTMFSATFCVLGSLVPETYAPVLLRRKALHLSRQANSTVIGAGDEEKEAAIPGIAQVCYKSIYDLKLDPTETFLHKIRVNVQRPFIMLIKESICLFFAIYAAVVYGILYLMFGAYPIVFVEGRGWKTGVAGLPFIGIGLGTLIGIIINVFVNKKYTRDLIKNGGTLPPEARLPISIVGGFALPAGLFWFAWTVQPEVHFIVPIIASIPFGLGMVLIFLATTNYLVDAYLMYAASALAANAVLRSIFGAVFPLFTQQMFHGLGTHWALTLLGFVTLALSPIPFVFIKYGARIRAGSTFAPGHIPAHQGSKNLSRPPTRNEEDLAMEVEAGDIRQRQLEKDDKREVQDMIACEKTQSEIMV